MRRWAVLLTLVLTGCAIPRWPVSGPMTSPFGMRWSGLLPEVHRGPYEYGVPGQAEDFLPQSAPERA